MTPPHHTGYRREIDGLRAFAVLSVVAFHAFPGAVPGGFVGVDVFFVISGFLITSHIFEKLDQGAFSFADFFQRRIRRIFPALLVVMSLSLLFGWLVLLSDEFNQLGLHVASGAAFISNFVFAAEAGYFDAAAELKPMLHLWSLAVEEQFYILWPLALWVAWKLRVGLLILTLIVFAASFVVNVVYATSHPVEAFFWPFGRFWELLSGSLLAWVTVHRRSPLASETVRKLAGGLGLVLLVVSVAVIDRTAAFPSWWAILPVLGSVLVIFGGATAWGVAPLFTNRVAVWFGLISYPLYLWHWPVLSFLHIAEDDVPHRDARIAGVLLAILLAWLTYRLIERPIRFGTFREPARSLWLAAIMVAVGLAGFVISRTDFSDTHTARSVYLRGGLEHRIGPSSRWFEGRDDWLFLGNSYDRTVAKLRSDSPPPPDEVVDTRALFAEIAETAARSGTRVALIVGPNKSSVYPEYLPPELTPADSRYFGAFAQALGAVPNLTFHDPTAGFLRDKEAEGELYFRTDTHWNSKGAFLAWDGLMQALGLPVPEVAFVPGPEVRGDIIEIAGMERFPLRPGDNWLYEFRRDFELERRGIPDATVTDSFGLREVVTNSNPPSDMTVWVIGDSFASSVKPFIEASFREVHHKGHWNERLPRLADDLNAAEEKPDLIVVIRVERSF
ncbi:O-acetyltransferase OatA [Roseovarius sp. THAF8]|uniref:acyltransferase family protein n=1 Tax=Roseovarius sp. THAF8 TaxID=2587846 RepID=UPI00126974D4|nr:acyltransferase family protein [Roseovarius sp. THAF8]QFT95916.1 O-acetyltransferase OatA [Roseovarius sp. THAF8]